MTAPCSFVRCILHLWHTKVWPTCLSHSKVALSWNTQRTQLHTARVQMHTGVPHCGSHKLTNDGRRAFTTRRSHLTNAKWDNKSPRPPLYPLTWTCHTGMV